MRTKTSRRDIKKPAEKIHYFVVYRLTLGGLSFFFHQHHQKQKFTSNIDNFFSMTKLDPTDQSLNKNVDDKSLTQKLKCFILLTPLKLALIAEISSLNHRTQKIAINKKFQFDAY